MLNKIIESLESEIEELEDTLNNLQQEVDRLEEEKLQAMIAQIGDNEENIREYIKRILMKK